MPIHLQAKGGASLHKVVQEIVTVLAVINPVVCGTIFSASAADAKPTALRFHGRSPTANKQTRRMDASGIGRAPSMIAAASIWIRSICANPVAGRRIASMRLRSDDTTKFVAIPIGGG
jgi:hypothetical protein